VAGPSTKVISSSEARSPLPLLHLVTDDAILRRPDFAGRAAVVLGAGGSRVALHLRGHGLGGAELYRVAARVADPTRRRWPEGPALLVNDRVDVALALDADGVQLGVRSLPIRVVRRMLPRGRLLGYSAHAAAEAAAARRWGADFVFMGPVYATPSHPTPGAGPALVAAAGAAAPIVAIGGITPERVREVVAAGAAGIAVRSGVWAAADPVAAVVAFLRALDETAGPTAPAQV
jgi:thiamine-phosphate diphosphorylase